MRRLLIVEDHATTCFSLQRTFRKQGWDVSIATTLHDAFAALDPLPDCILLDLNLPDGPGEQLLRQVRESGAPVRVAVCTGLADSPRWGEVQQLQPDLLLQKPIDPEVVSRVCDDAVG